MRFVIYPGTAYVALALAISQIEMTMPAALISPVQDDTFDAVFGILPRIIVASVTAYPIGRLLDTSVFHALRTRTGARLLWLPVTGSTVVSQPVDSFVVLFIAFGSQPPAGPIAALGVTNDIDNMGIALGIAPLLYLVHGSVDR